MVYRKGEIVTDENYKTVKGAKISFLKSFSFMAHNEKISANWSHIITPDTKWLDKILKY